MKKRRRHNLLGRSGLLLPIISVFAATLILLGVFSLYNGYEMTQQFLKMRELREPIYRQIPIFQPRIDMFVLPLFSIASGGVLLLIATFRYLQGSRASVSQNLFSENGDALLQEVIQSNNTTLKALEISVNDFGTKLTGVSREPIEFSRDEKTQIIEALTKSVVAGFSSDVIRAFDEQYSARVIQDRRWDRLLFGLNAIRERLLREVGNLSRRANLNLVIGVATTMLAVVGLLYAVFGHSIDLTNTPNDERVAKILVYYLPRLSLIVFIEVFAYFFLRLYKVGLSDIKFYQNELTNVETKIAALESSFISTDQGILSMVIAELSKTERNFILRKDETTVELEKSKLESMQVKDVLQQIPSLLKAKSSA